MNTSKRSSRGTAHGTARGRIAIAAFAALASLGAVTIMGTSANAQVDSTAAVKVGDTAPDFSAPGATRYGLLRDPVSLADYRGKTVVLAFFYKARTKG